MLRRQCASTFSLFLSHAVRMSSSAPHELSREELQGNLRCVLQRIAEAVPPAAPGTSTPLPLLVAASKTMPSSYLRALYDAGHRTFGENYVKEVVEKAPEMPSDVDWHFIGHLQSNKVKELLTAAPSLAVVETVDTEKLAAKLNDGVMRYRESRPLDVYIQVNTSGEETKSGVTPEEALSLAKFIITDCPLLRLTGLMTIGMPDYTSKPENFICLAECREELQRQLELERQLELSMGMSGDYVNAIAMGSTVVRVGTSLFGARLKPVAAANDVTPDSK